MDAFTFSSFPTIYYGSGKLSIVPKLLNQFGRNIIVVVGRQSFLKSSHWESLKSSLNKENLGFEIVVVENEPSPNLIDDVVSSVRNKKVDVILAVGGGSVLDAGKAISAMIPIQESVKDYLEGIGNKTHPGIKIPMIAVPTTAGTGSEATKNAVLSEVGASGYKKSLRHQNFVPNMAVLDPLLTLHCPPSVTATSGMDAFTQLLESYLSTSSNPISDSLSKEGLRLVSNSLIKSYKQGDNVVARSEMLLASTLSGITLANVGLGLVHGFASAIGGFFEMPHGAICSALMMPANKWTVMKLRKEYPGHMGLKKYAEIGAVFSNKLSSDEYNIDFLLDLINDWSRELNIPRLAASGITVEDLPKIAAATDNKQNPIALSKEEMIEVLKEAL